MPGLIELPAWQALAQHQREMAEVHMRDLFAQDPQRGERFAVDEAGLYLSYSHQRVTAEISKP